MPTHILYEAMYPRPTHIKGEETAPSFFEQYNPYAVKGSLMEIRRPHLRDSERRNLCENDLLCNPNKWANDVFNGLYRNGNDGKRLLAEICRFLFDASFYGFSLEHIFNGHLDRVAAEQDYHNAEGVLRVQCPAIFEEAIDAILRSPTVSPFVTTFKVCYDLKSGDVQRRRFVSQKHLRRFKRVTERKRQALEELVTG